MLPILCYFVAAVMFAGSVYLLTGAVPGFVETDVNLIFLGIAGSLAALVLATFGRICEMLEKLVKQRALGARRATREAPAEPRLVTREQGDG